MNITTISSIIPGSLEVIIKDIDTEHENEDKLRASTDVQVYPRRYFFLLVVSTGSLLSTITFSQYSIIGDILKEYYGVSYIMIEWTSMTYLLGYIIPMYPTLIMFDRKGLKFSFVLGLFSVAIGMWIQGIGTHIDKFWLILLGQCFIGLAQCCFVNLTPQFVSYWFDTNEVSRACAVGIFFNLSGMALSCIFSSALVKNFLHLSISSKLSYLNYALASVTSALTLFSAVVFEEHPPSPPSEAQAKIWNKSKNQTSATAQLLSDFKDLLKNRNFVFHLISSSMMLSFVTFSIIILNQLISTKHPDHTDDVGKIGLVMYFMGIPGTLVLGIIVDKTHKYKETTLGNNICTFLSLCFFVGSIYLNITAIYVASVLFGFFMVGYVNIGLEMGSEISYPTNEVASSSLILFLGCSLGIAMTFISNWLLQDFDFFISLIVLLVYCFVGMLLSGFVKSDLRRIAASKKETPT